MQLSRLFNLVVVQSTLVLGACDDDPADDMGAEATNAEGGDEATSEATTHAHDAGTSDDGTTDDGTTDDGDSTDAGESSSADDAPELACSDDPRPDDPCGCPCCWAIDCVNTDTACCGEFSKLCTPT